MAIPIKHKRGTANPGASDLVVGELAINTTEGSVFTKTDGGAAVKINALVADGAIIEYATTISSSYTITANKQAESVGTIAISQGATVTVSSGSTWRILE